ncbi:MULTISPECIES: RAMP superfamily CRISPR-associated protein [Nostocales]|uniref:RAMP superfamily CRISPR-associated protein n=1 Tax=Nostocales TaxID=1161 RepID=UPI001686E5EF|nr:MULTISPECIES: RAMP superfamily CRISPR-associated protein [Nostocales]MBD2302809.1 RAMP superfamily protein [Nostoc sp. FACHB-190]MBD2492183.1 RAMP superfamily protein [Aulosira sp. FACHB-615]
MYTGSDLAKLLEKQHQRRGTSNLFKKDTFILQWRSKVGSFPHPDVETMVSAGEPCGAWHVVNGRPEDKRQLDENLEQMLELPLNGYIPGSSIRGIVRAWAMKRPGIRMQMFNLLGSQQGNIIQEGKIEFLDAWPEIATKLVLDIVNPQQNFQVYHEGQGKPISIYTLGDGEDTVSVTVAIRGIPGKATPQDVQIVWEWVQQALSIHGVGSRTSAGYGQIKAPSGFIPSPQLRQVENGYTTKTFEFKLYSQGCAGADRQQQDFRPSHWRGWLRSWILRFLLGVMSKDNAEITLSELMGIIEPETRKGCVKIRMIPDTDIWSDRSSNQPYFYVWEGKLEVTAPTEILNKIILPIIRFAVSTGSVGRGWRRPLHIFHMNNGYAATRGSHLVIKHQVRNREGNLQKRTLSLLLNPESWTSTYDNWLTAVRSQWADRINTNANHSLEAEVFSPRTCAVYAVPGSEANPIDENDFEWLETDAVATRGDGMHLIYEQTPPRNYKRNPDIGGNAADKNPHCSWASIKRINIPSKEIEVDCQEIVCLFMGGKTPQSNHIRAQFLKDLNKIEGKLHLFGVSP